jgi:hypothetical protein
VFLAFGNAARRTRLPAHHTGAAARTATGTGRPISNRKHSEAANFNSVSPGQRRPDLTQDRVDHVLEVTLVEMVILRSDASIKL